ncbi:MAG: right-handed parallel beta-helix repeat-containing protein [Verrucomicrobia bacterium]|nr:right-handed parallel beta-helix repeat-containing protein [Verrucomicrobiota bacterium]
MNTPSRNLRTLLGGVGPLCLALGLPAANLLAKEITVPSGSILTIQQAVDAATPGDTIIVLPGTYANVSIDPSKPGLTLRAVGPPGSVKVVGLGASVWNVGIYIQADDVSVQGFAISNATDGIRALSTSHGVRITDNQIGNLSGPYGAAIEIDSSSGVEVARNTLFGAVPQEGVGVSMSSDIHVHDNSAINCAVGDDFIVLSGSTDCEIDHNTLHSGGNPNSGIFLNGWSPAGPNTQHHIHHNRMDNAVQGIFLWQSPKCVLDYNTCDSNQTGIYVASSPNCTVDHNEADNNGQQGGGSGIGIGDSPDSIVTYNQATSNAPWGIIVGSSCGTLFAHNSAEGNGQWDLYAPNWDPSSPPTCNTYLDNHAGTASPSLALWDVQ